MFTKGPSPVRAFVQSQCSDVQQTAARARTLAPRFLTDVDPLFPLDCVAGGVEG